MVPVTDTDEGWQALRVALMVARRFEGHVDAIFIQPHIRIETSEVLPTVDQQLRVEIAERAREQMASHIRQAHNTFEEITSVLNVADQNEPSESETPPATWYVQEGLMSDTVRTRASVYDAVIFSHPIGKPHADWRPSVEAALFSAGRPVLVAPSQDIVSVGESVLVGWNRSPHQRERWLVRCLCCSERSGLNYFRLQRALRKAHHRRTLLDCSRGMGLLPK